MIIINIATTVHVTTKRNSHVQDAINSQYDPQIPRMQRRYNPVLMHSATMAAIILACVMGGSGAFRLLWIRERTPTLLEFATCLEAIWFVTMVVVPIAAWALGLSPTLNKVVQEFKEECFPTDPPHSVVI